MSGSLLKCQPFTTYQKSRHLRRTPRTVRGQRCSHRLSGVSLRASRGGSRHYRATAATPAARSAESDRSQPEEPGALRNLLWQIRPRRRGRERAARSPGHPSLSFALRRGVKAREEQPQSRQFLRLRAFDTGEREREKARLVIAAAAPPREEERQRSRRGQRESIAGNAHERQLARLATAGTAGGVVQMTRIGKLAASVQGEGGRGRLGPSVDGQASRFLRLVVLLGTRASPFAPLRPRRRSVRRSPLSVALSCSKSPGLKGPSFKPGRWWPVQPLTGSVGRRTSEA